VEDLKQMKHKSVAHKEAVRLYLKEKEKPGGMSLRQVQDHIAKEYSVTVHYSTISRYANEGLLNALPKKMGPAGKFAKSTYKLLCDALSSFIPINQMNACAGDNSRIKLIHTLVKTLSISSTEASTLLTRLLHDTAEDTMSADKLNCAEDRRIRWTTFQILDLWFNSWEFFLSNLDSPAIMQMASSCSRMVR
jgi:transposase-like protein